MYEKKTYDQEYHRQNLVRRVLNFNRKNEEDMMVLEHMDAQENYSKYLKNLVMADIKKEAAK